MQKRRDAIPAGRVERGERNGVDYIFGLAGNDVVRERVRGAADDLCVRRAEAGMDKLRGFRAFDYAAKSWRASGWRKTRAIMNRHPLYGTGAIIWSDVSRMARSV